MSTDNAIDWLADPTERERSDRRTGLVAIAEQIKAQGWAAYRFTLGADQLAGLAVLLADDQLLVQLGETESTVLARYARALYGEDGGRADAALDYRATRAWFAQAHTELTAPPHPSR